MLIKSKGKGAFTEPRYVISIPDDNICTCLVIRSGCEAWQLIQPEKGKEARAMTNRVAGSRRQRKAMNKKTRKTLQNSLESIDTSVLCS